MRRSPWSHVGAGLSASQGPSLRHRPGQYSDWTLLQDLLLQLPSFCTTRILQAVFFPHVANVYLHVCTFVCPPETTHCAQPGSRAIAHVTQVLGVACIQLQPSELCARCTPLETVGSKSTCVCKELQDTKPIHISMHCTSCSHCMHPSARVQP